MFRSRGVSLRRRGRNKPPPVAVATIAWTSLAGPFDPDQALPVYII